MGLAEDDADGAALSRSRRGSGSVKPSACRTSSMSSGEPVEELASPAHVRRGVGQHVGRVLLGLERERVEEDIASDQIAEQLHLAQIGGVAWAHALAAGVHEAGW